MKSHVLSATLALVLLVTGCTTGKPEPAPETTVRTPAPATPTDPYATLGPEYEEAEQVVRAMFELEKKYLYGEKTGPFPEEEFAEYTSGYFLDVEAYTYDSYKSKQLLFENVEAIELLTRPMPEDSYDASVAQIFACQDETAVELSNPAGETG